jgi:3-hydroxyacyl-CoA dehydrogenase
MLGERWPTGTTMMETPAVRLWHLGDDIGIVSFKSKANTIGEDVLDGIQAAIERAERECAGLVLWQTKEPFSLGANLAAIEPAIKAGQWDAIEAVVAKFQQTSLRFRYSLVPTVAAVRGMALGGSCEFILHCDRTVAALESYIGLVEAGVRAGRWDAVERVVAKFQQTSQRLRYSLVPTVAAVRGMALGGSCEFILHCDRTVAALESYIGLVEAGVGLLPGGGGCKEIAVRAAQEVARGVVGSQLDQLPFLRTYFQTVAMAKVSRSAGEGNGLFAPRGSRRVQCVRSAARCAGDGTGACGNRVPPAAVAAQHSGRRPHGYRGARDDAR